MPLYKRWGSIVAVLGLGSALGLTWSVVGAGQGQIRHPAQKGAENGTWTWGDGTTVDHMVPGDPWPEEAWPSHKQRFYLKQLANYDPQIYATWSKRLNQAIAHKQLDKRTERVFVAAMDALVHSPLSVIEQHVDQAFDAGSNAGELTAVMSEGAENSAHSTHDGRRPRSPRRSMARRSPRRT
jgi:hypothetical protein